MQHFHFGILKFSHQLFDNVYFTFVYFLRDKCLLENSGRNEARKILVLHAYILQALTYFRHLKVVIFVKVIHPKYSKHLPNTVAHTIDCVCSKMFKLWVISFTFQVLWMKINYTLQIAIDARIFTQFQNNLIDTGCAAYLVELFQRPLYTIEQLENLHQVLPNSPSAIFAL